MKLLMRRNIRNLFAVFLLSVFLCACASETVGVATGDIQKTLSADVRAIYKNSNGRTELTLEEALARAVRFNLDVRVAEYEEMLADGDLMLESLSVLPAMTAKTQFIGRNNLGASSSLSVLTGVQSLEPSISTPRQRMVQQMQLNWNLMDLGMDIGRIRSASDRKQVTQERRRKVYHNVVQDTYAAYWRCAAAQRVAPVVRDLLQQAEKQISIVDQSVATGGIPLGDSDQLRGDLLDKKQQLMQLQDQLALAEIELKTMIAIPPSAKISLKLPSADWLKADTLPRLGQDMEKLEAMALVNRPEVREEFLNKKIAARNVKLTLFETLPGAELALDYNHDHNRYLSDPEWISITGSLIQNITKILTAPARYGKAKEEVRMADTRRQALVAAVLTQVHVARERFGYYSDSYNLVVATEDNKLRQMRRAEAFENAGLMGQTQMVGARLDAGIAQLNRVIAYAGAQEAYGRLIDTLGIDLWGEGQTDGMSIPELAAALKENLSNIETRTLQGAAASTAITTEVPRS